MPEENENLEVEETAETQAEENASAPVEPAARRRFFSRRNLGISLALIAAAVLVLILAGVFSYRYGYVDAYIKTQFITKMDQIGITFTADTFRTTLSPLSLELGNAQFVNKRSGEQLFRIDNAKIGLTITNLYAWQLSRDLRVDSTDINGAEVWITFDEEGRSNFSNLQFVQEEGGYVNFNYTSAKFSLQNGLIHFGDRKRSVSADGRNIVLGIQPENPEAPDEQKRYRFDFTSTDSLIVYDQKPIEPVDVRLRGIAYREGAEITELNLKSPIAESTLTGRIEGWEDFRYNFQVDSTIDLTQTGTIFASGTALRGMGNFKGTVSGAGENYRIEGEINSDALAASNVRLKALQMTATVNGTSGENPIYEANGKAIAEMLTYEDFKIDFPQLIGNVRGTGTDFKWWGELQAAAARSPLGTVGSLFISDAVAEYKDKQFEATFGNISARHFFSKEAEIEFLRAQNARLNYANGQVNVSLPNVSAGTVRVEGAEMRSVAANDIKVRNQGDKTEIEASRVRAENLRTKDANLKNLSAGRVNVTRSSNGATTAEASQVQTGEIDAGGAKIGNLNAARVNIEQSGNETRINAPELRVGSIVTTGAVIGSLNIAGVRLTIREGRVEGSSGDINAGNVDLRGNGNLEDVRLARPVFVLEPSGRYRASADMSLGGGVIGSIRLGAARADVVATSGEIALNNLTAEVMEGSLAGSAIIATNERNNSQINADFTNLDLSKLVALQGGRVIPLAGQASGKVDLTFPGTNFRAASGSLTADFTANAGTSERGLIPVNGRVGLIADKGLFNIDYANLNTENSRLTATGQFDLGGYDSNLNISLKSADAGEIQRLITVLNISPELERQINSNRIQLAGNLTFDGNLTGSLDNPTIDGRAALDSISMRERTLGSLATNIFVSPEIIELRNGILQEPAGGGNAAFSVSIPQTGANNITVQATLNRINTGNLIAALPVDALPSTLRDIQAETSGTLNLTGLPNEMRGEAEIRSGAGTISGQPFEGFDTRLTFEGTLATLEKFEARFADGYLRAKGTYRNDSTEFDLDIEGRNLQAARLRPLLPNNESFPDFAGTLDLNAKAAGLANDTSTFNVNFEGVGRNITVSGNPFGDINFKGNTVDRQLNANLTASIESQRQEITATLNFADPDLPVRAVTEFNNTELAPFIALLRAPNEQVKITGRATGNVDFAGKLMALDADGNRVFSTENLSGTANLTQLALQVNDTPFAATSPLTIRFTPREVTINNARFAGAGSNLVVNGTKAFAADAVNNLTVDGTINLRVLDALSRNTFFAGLADVSVRLTGVNRDARLSGTAQVQNASISTFVGSERLNFTRINGRVLFTSNQVQIEQAVGYLGGGKVLASGGALLDNLRLEGYRLELRGTNITAPLPQGFVTTADADITITGRRIGSDYDTLIAGTLFARRAVYTEDIDIADVIGSRREGSISEGSGGASVLGVPRLDIVLQGRDSLIVRNNLADLTASADLRITGDVNDPVITGRVTANEGLLFYRNDRYTVQRGIVEFPVQANRDPFVNLQAETEIQGYQITVNLVGELSDLSSLNATLRSNPALPQADVVSLITTGSLANTSSGIPTLAQTGINTAAEVLTDALINDPLRRATDKLFGLNRFEIDPILSGTRLNPTARLTVGRQINRNLLITYSTNLSEDQQQVLALEYRVSNRLSFVAQYEQRSLSNVTRNRDNFSFEIRLRKRF